MQHIPRPRSGDLYWRGTVYQQATFFLARVEMVWTIMMYSAVKPEIDLKISKPSIKTAATSSTHKRHFSIDGYISLRSGQDS